MPIPASIATRAKQTKLLVKKNYLLAKRNRRSTIIQITVPFVFIFALFVLKFAIEANQRFDKLLKVDRMPPREQVRPFPRCIAGESTVGPCLTIVYASNGDPLAYQLVEHVRQRHNIPQREVRNFTSSYELDVYLDTHRNSTQGAYLINVTRGPGPSDVHIDYVVMYNETETTSFGRPVDPVVYTLLPFQEAIEKAIMEVAAGASYTMELLEFAHPELLTFNVISEAGPAFFFAALMFNFVTQLGSIVTEKEQHLREGMAQMGLKASAYWFSWFITNTLFNQLSVMLLILAGAIFQFDFFLVNDFRAYYFLFFLFGMAMVTMAFTVSTLVKRAATATSLGFLLFLFGVIVQVFQELIYRKSTQTFWKVIFSLFPFVLLSKGIADISAKSDNEDDGGFKWSDRSNNSDFSLTTVYGWLIFDFFFYAVLTWYLDNIIPTSHGIRRPFYFPFTRSYWTGAASTPNDDAEPSSDDSAEEEDSNLAADEHVTRENVMATNNSFPADTAVAIHHLYKEYASGILCNKRTFKAVNNLSLHMENGTLFCILGHNGAGKSTTINMLTGLFLPTGGRALIHGHDIRSEMDTIRSIMGICHQHDILYDQLTAAEHIELYAALKGLPNERIDEEVRARLDDVDLRDVADVTSGAFSGGMRRRLSTAIAFVGDPRVVFLDEPTTGMDAVARRKVWNMIEKKKSQQRCIVLTTHSMEEANVLADNIAIMSKGRLSTIGSSLWLKNKFGTGYNMRLVCSSMSAVDRVVPFVRRRFGDLEPLPSQFESLVLSYTVPRRLINDLSGFLTRVNSNDDIVDVQISMTTLEEVFLEVTRREEEDDAMIEDAGRRHDHNSGTRLHTASDSSQSTTSGDDVALVKGGEGQSSESQDGSHSTSGSGSEADSDSQSESESESDSQSESESESDYS